MSDYEEKNMLIDGLFEASANLEIQAIELEELRKIAEAACAHADSIESLAKHGRATGNEIALIKAVSAWRATAATKDSR